MYKQVKEPTTVGRGSGSNPCSDNTTAVVSQSTSCQGRRHLQVSPTPVELEFTTVGRESGSMYKQRKAHPSNPKSTKAAFSQGEPHYLFMKGASHSTEKQTQECQAAVAGTELGAEEDFSGCDQERNKNEEKKKKKKKKKKKNRAR